MPNQSLRCTYIILACLSHAAFAEERAAAGVYSPIEANEIESTPETIFRGASLAIYEPLDFAVVGKNTVDIATRQTTVIPLPPAQLATPAANYRLVTATPPPIAEPGENTPLTKIARGEITEPPPKRLTENLVTNLGWSLGAIVLSTALDRSGDRFAREHGQSVSTKAFIKTGNFLPFIAIGAAGLAALDSTDPRLSRTGLAALQAGGLSAASGLGLKYLFARARPDANLGPSQFNASSTKRSDSSMPSIHSATIWGVITPFAKEYDMPWLYGLGVLTNFARVADRKHWVSDTVAGSVLGYWLGDIAWHHNRSDDRSSTQVSLGGRSVAFSWSFQ